MLDTLGSTYSQDVLDIISEKEVTYERVYEYMEGNVTDIGIKKCPFCEKRIQKKHDLDVVSHVAVPSSTQLLTESYAPLMILEKLIISLWVGFLLTLMRLASGTRKLYRTSVSVVMELARTMVLRN
jgi:hypothetical protein